MICGGFERLAVALQAVTAHPGTRLALPWKPGASRVQRNGNATPLTLVLPGKPWVSRAKRGNKRGNIWQILIDEII